MDAEQPPVLANTLLSEKDWPRRVKPNQNCQGKKEREKNRQPYDTKETIKKTFHDQTKTSYKAAITRSWSASDILVKSGMLIIDRYAASASGYISGVRS